MEALKTTLTRVGVLATLACAVLPRHTAAQITFDAQVSPMVTGTLYLSDPPDAFAIERQGASPVIVHGGEIAHSFGVGVNGGILIAGDVGLEAVVWWLPTELSASEGLAPYGGKVDVNALMYGLTAVYYFPHIASAVEPFVGVGVGWETMSYDRELAWQRHTSFMSHAVVGGHFWLNDRLALRAEGRDCLTRFHSNVEGQGSTNEHDLMFSAGLTFRAQLRR